MDLNKLYTSERIGSSDTSRIADPRSEFQRDFDRIIFSSAFRRLQNKTQVFPLPGSVFVHNRLTHSLEVSSVARSLGSLIGKRIYNTQKDLTPESQSFYKNNLKNVLAAACLCHDIGNPAFGHSGEDAIASFFLKNLSVLEKYFDKAQFSDFISFEGNANAIRVLTNHQPGKSIGGLKLTYTTLASIAKYPCESLGRSKSIIHRKKFGFFQSEKEIFEKMASKTGMIKDGNNPNLGYLRHPFVWLVEFADDVCYHIVDLEDAQRLGIIDTKHCIKLLLELIKCLNIEDVQKVKDNLNLIKDKNEKISYLRAKAINTLIRVGEDIFMDEGNFKMILAGEFETSIFDIIAKDCDALQNIIKFSLKYIYNNRAVVEIENAGYNVMYELLNHFIFPLLKNKSERTKSEEKAIQLIPKQFRYLKKGRYNKVMGVLDYISGMTDIYAMELYKKIKGIEIGMK